MIVALKAWIDIAGATAVRGIAGYILEFAFLMTARAGVRRGGGRQQKAAAPAFPVGQAATGTESGIGWVCNRLAAIQTAFFILICHAINPHDLLLIIILLTFNHTIVVIIS